MWLFSHHYQLPFTTAELAAAGIGAHHAGLEIPDKRLVEELFMNGILRVVVATSVSRLLAIRCGCNFPYLF